MNKTKFYFLAALLIATAFLSGCSEIMQRIENPEVREDVESVLSAIEQEDTEQLYEKYFSYMDKDEFTEDFSHLCSVFQGKVTEIRLNNINSSTHFSKNGNGEKTYFMQSQYLIETTEKDYILIMTYRGESAEQRKLAGFNISENLNYVVNSNFADYDSKTWTLFLLNFVSYGIIIAALILCIKTKMKKKVLWIILILMQFKYTNTVFPHLSSQNINFVSILGFSKYLIFAHGGTITIVMLPILAIVFLLLRKSLNRKYMQEQDRIDQEALNEEEILAENSDGVTEKLEQNTEI